MLLAEKIVVLTIDEETGEMNAPLFFGYAVLGALIIELLFLKKIRLEKKRFKVLVQTQDSTPMGKKALDYLLQEISNSDSKPLGRWIRKYCNYPDQKIMALLIESMKEEGIIREVIETGVFKKNKYPLTKPTQKKEIIEEIRTAITIKAEPTQNALALLALIDATWMTRNLLEREDRRLVKEKMKKLLAKREKSLLRKYSESIYYVAKTIKFQVSGAAA